MLEEKYRPQSLDEVVGQDEVINKIRKYMDREPQDIPHFLFYGGSGVGKTATAGAIKNELGANMIEMNASDDRGVDVIRDRVIPAMRSLLGGHKIIFMDEADMLTEESQRALRRPLEQYHRATVIMTCNREDRIIDAIHDRMNVYHFTLMNDDTIIEHLKRIAEKEGIGDVDYGEIVDRAKGSMRKAIKLLEDGEGNDTLISKETLEMAKQMGL